MAMSGWNTVPSSGSPNTSLEKWLCLFESFLAWIDGIFARGRAIFRPARDRFKAGVRGIVNNPVPERRQRGFQPFAFGISKRSDGPVELNQGATHAPVFEIVERLINLIQCVAFRNQLLQR